MENVEAAQYMTIVVIVVGMDQTVIIPKLHLVLEI